MFLSANKFCHVWLKKVKVLVSKAAETFKRNILISPPTRNSLEKPRLHIFSLSQLTLVSRRWSANAVPLMQSGEHAGRVGAAAARWRTAPSKAELMRTHRKHVILYFTSRIALCAYSN
jgi:hypothetical protein